MQIENIPYIGRKVKYQLRNKYHQSILASTAIIESISFYEDGIKILLKTSLKHDGSIRYVSVNPDQVTLLE